MMNKQKEKEADEMYGPMYFFKEGDGIESIRSKIGDREIKGGYQGPVDLTAQEATEEPKEEEEKNEVSENSEETSESSEKKEDEKTESEDPELDEVEVKLLTDQHLTYITPSDGVAEAEKYMTYLLQEKEFKILTYPKGSEGEIPREPVQAEDTEEESKDSESEDSKSDDSGQKSEEGEDEEPEFVPPEQGYYIAAVDNKDDVEEGDPSEIKRIRMDYTQDSYRLRLSTANGEVDDLIPPEPEEEPVKTVTMSSAVDKLEGMTDAQLQLPKSMDHYEMTPIQGKTILHGIEFYNVRAYEEGPDDTLLYGGSYFVSCEGDTIYKHDEATGERTLVSGVDILAGVEQQKPSKNDETNEDELMDSTVVISGNP